MGLAEFHVLVASRHAAWMAKLWPLEHSEERGFRALGTVASACTGSC